MAQQDDEHEPKQSLLSRVFNAHRKVVDVELEQIEDWRKSVGVRLYRFFLLLMDVMYRTELPRRAASLTYTTILSIFPVIAVVTSTASFFYTEEKEAQFMGMLERTLLPSFDMGDFPIGMSESEQQLIEQQRRLTEGVRKLFSEVSTKFRESAGGVGVFGFIGLLVTGGILYWSIESAVNTTWHTLNRGNWSQTITNFITILVLAPIVVGLSLAASTFAVTLLDRDGGSEAEIVETLEEEPEEIPDSQKVPPGITPPDEKAADEAAEDLGDVVSEVVGRPRIIETIRRVTTRFGFLLPLIPMVINTLILSAAYSFLPKTRVKYRWALVGAFVAACLWELARYLFFFYLFFSTVNRTLTDALGLSVVFLIWVYITWIILLLGNAIVYVLQTSGDLWSEKRTCNELLIDDRLLVAVMILLARKFMKSGGGLPMGEIRGRLGLRQSEFEQIIDRLIGANYVSMLKGESYQIARPPQQIALRELLALGCNLNSLPATSRQDSTISKALSWLQRHHLDLAGDVYLDELVDHPEALD